MCAHTFPTHQDQTCMIECRVGMHMYVDTVPGCNLPSSSLLLRGAGYGCAPGCQRTPEYLHELESAPCNDSLLEVTTSFSEQLREIGRQWKLEGGWSEIISALATGGCEAYMAALAPFYLALDPPYSFELYACGGLHAGNAVGPNFLPGIKPIQSLCPVTCRCKGGDYECPKSCPATSLPRTRSQVNDVSCHPCRCIGMLQNRCWLRC